MNDKFEKIKKNKYYHLYKNLDNYNFNFIKFPIKINTFFNKFKLKNIDEYYFIFNYLFNNHEILYLFKSFNLSKKDLNILIQTIHINFLNLNKILHFIKNKKKIILGLIWNVLGYYLSSLILKKLKINFNDNFIDLVNNNYFIFLTCCYVYYDELLDSENDKNKLYILDFTNYFFSNIDDFKNFNDLKMKFTKNKNNNINLEEVSSILKIFFDEYKLNKNVNLKNVIIKLFHTEIYCSKYQKLNKNILEITFLKSHNSLLCFLEIIINNKNLENYTEIDDLLYLYGFISQLLDDFNDIIYDKIDNIYTLFTNNNQLINTTEKLLKLIYYDKNQYNNKFLLNLIIFNYGICKIKNIEYFNEYLPFDNNYLLEIRKIKNQNIKKLFNKKSVNFDYIITEINNYYDFYEIMNSHFNKLLFRFFLKREIYFKKKYIKNLIVYNNNG